MASTIQACSTNRARILVVEDNPADVRLLEQAFIENEFLCELKVLRDGREAIRFVSQATGSDGELPPHLILLDLNLPFHGGFEVLERVRANPFFRHSRVAIVTTSDAPEDRRQAELFQVDLYLQKPGSLDAFMALGKPLKSLCEL
jgi:CheY-like chemotaxis protein